MDKPLLSICIPTFSRAHFLRECLDSITTQFADLAVAGRVEIAVSDNASTDNTRELIESYQKKFSNIRYSRNAENLGYDRNVSAALALGWGQFRWLMSDDEALAPGSIAYILALIKAHPEAGYICVNHGNNPQTRDIEVYPNGNAWLAALGMAGGLISQNIYNSSFLPRDIEKYYDNLWIHFSIALEILANHPGILVKKLFLDPAVPRKTTWAGGGQAFNTYNCLNKIIRHLPALGYNKKITNSLLAGIAKGLPKNVASAKIHDLKISTKGIKVLVNEYRRYPFWLLAAFLVYFTPNGLLKAVKKFKL